MDKIKEMATVMQQAAEMDDNHFNNDSQRLTQLLIENKGLRELLQISKENGSIAQNVLGEDKSIQTDDDINDNSIKNINNKKCID